MDLIKLSEELTMDQIAELLARKILMDDQRKCHTMGDERTLANPDLLAHMAKHSSFMLLRVKDKFGNAVADSIEDHVEEYTR